MMINILTRTPPKAEPAEIEDFGSLAPVTTPEQSKALVETRELCWRPAVSYHAWLEGEKAQLLSIRCVLQIERADGTPVLTIDKVDLVKDRPSCSRVLSFP